MSNIVKLLLIAIAVVTVLTAGIILGVPSLRKSIFGKEETEMTQEEQDAAQIAEDAKKEVRETEERILATKQVFELAEQLKKREEVVKEQENRIIRLQAALDAERDEIQALKDEVAKMHKEIAQFIPLITDGEKKNLKKLARMFETLSPENANPIIAGMPDQTLVIVLSFMKPRNSAKILSGYAGQNQATAKRAARLTQYLKNLVMS